MIKDFVGAFGRSQNQESKNEVHSGYEQMKGEKGSFHPFVSEACQFAFPCALLMVWGAISKCLQAVVGLCCHDDNALRQEPPGMPKSASNFDAMKRQHCNLKTGNRLRIPYIRRYRAQSH